MTNTPKNTKSNNIKSWNEEDQPREKLLKTGKQHLSDSELLAILIGSGSKENSAVDLCSEILNFVNNDLSVLGKQSVADLCKFKGIGPAKAISIIAALELGRRRQSENVKDLKKISSSNDVFRIFINLLSDIPHEEFWVLYLNIANRILGKEKISHGGVSSTIADKKIIIKSALDRLASGIILVHNHPSGNLKPSKSDIELTNKTKEACKLLDINILDHVILSSSGYFSFADEGLI